MEGAHFIGRGPELAALERALSSARAGEGGLFLVEGDPGMGKTALAHELTRRAGRDGVRACWGSCLEDEGAPAYRPWIQVLERLDADPENLLAPEGDSRFRQFGDTVDVLRAASRELGPLLLVLDDLHWADMSSMRLLQALAPELPESRLLVVGTCRATEMTGELPQILSALSRERAVNRITLGRLEPSESTQITARILRRRPEPELLRAVERRAEGNPLFIVELVRLAAATGSGRGALPAGVRDVIGRRLDRLPAATRRLLGQASVLGREFSVRLLGEITGLQASQMVENLDPAIDADLVIASGHSLRFAHSLMQEVAYDELPTIDRQRLHQRAAAAIGEAEHLVDARAHHLRRSIALGDAELALQVTLQAAERASGQLAHEHAVVQYGHALDLLDQLPHGRVGRGQVLLELARCQFRAGAIADAWASCRAAADLGRAAGDAVTLAEAATIVRGLLNDPICDEIHALSREALNLLRGADPVLEARLLGQLAVTASPWTRNAETELSRRALTAAEATGDPDALFLALQARHADLVDCRYAPERLTIGERAIQLGDDTGRDQYRFWGHQWRVDAFWELSRRLQMDTELAALVGVVAHLNEPISTWRLGLVRASLALMEGRFQDAADLADHALVIGRRGGHQEADFYHMVFRSHLAPLVGDGETLAEVETFVRGFIQNGPFLARFWLVSVLADLGRLGEAGALFDSLLPHRDSFPRQTPEWIISTTSIADLCVQLDLPGLAPALYADLAPFADRQAIAGAQAPSRGPVALYLGRLALLQGDLDAAETHLATAMHLSGAMAAPPFEAMTRVATARLLLARRASGDAANADTHLVEAADIANRLGMDPLAAEAAKLLETTRGGRSTPLSPREEEVAALVSTGLSNRQIAARLHLSERTVENHVRSIFNKLGFDSRARVASWYTARPPQK